MYHESYQPSKTFSIQSQHERNSHCRTVRSCLSFFYQPFFLPFPDKLTPPILSLDRLNSSVCSWDADLELSVTRERDRCHLIRQPMSQTFLFTYAIFSTLQSQIPSSPLRRIVPRLSNFSFWATSSRDHYVCWFGSSIGGNTDLEATTGDEKRRPGVLRCNDRVTRSRTMFSIHKHY